MYAILLRSLFPLQILLAIFKAQRICVRARAWRILPPVIRASFATRKFPVYSVVATRDARIIVIQEKHVTRFKNEALAGLIARVHLSQLRNFPVYSAGTRGSSNSSSHGNNFNKCLEKHCPRGTIRAIRVN